jgi:hypothetical protein
LPWIANQDRMFVWITIGSAARSRSSTTYWVCD